MAVGSSYQNLSAGNRKGYDMVNREGLDLIESIVDDTGDWYSEDYRAEYMDMLRKLIDKPQYDHNRAALMYSYWKMHQSERVMKSLRPGVPTKAERAWMVLEDVHLGKLTLSEQLKARVK